ncbi:MAG: hypothetical protein DMF75_13555 [Acidobacteria bacterium]|nr:MAG: hypothetical protein DMF75_13555 [Acidobacteriota bacterium]
MRAARYCTATLTSRWTPFVIYVACFASSESQLRKEYQRTIHERTRNKTKLNSSDFAVFRVISWIAFALTRPFGERTSSKKKCMADFSLDFDSHLL